MNFHKHFEKLGCARTRVILNILVCFKVIYNNAE